MMKRHKNKIKVPYYVHLTADLEVGCMVEDIQQVEDILYTAAKKANSTPLKVAVHKFSPHGITGVILLAESHIAIHSWPEFNYLAVDIFTCGRKSRPRKALEYIQKCFKAKEIKVQEINEG